MRAGQVSAGFRGQTAIREGADVPHISRKSLNINSFFCNLCQGLHNQNLVEVSYSPAGSGVYLGSPSLLVLHESGRILCSHDTFPDGETTYVLESKDGGATWQNLSSVAAQYWSNLFMVQGRCGKMGRSSLL